MLRLDLQMWSAMIRRYCLDGRHHEAISLFVQNVRCSSVLKPNHLVFAAVLKSCAALFAIKMGEVFHGYFVKEGQLSCQSVSKGLLNLYAKCGALDDCQKLFGEICTRDAVTWNIILAGLSGLRIHDAKVMRSFYDMHISGDAKPNAVTVATILPVCARGLHANAGKTVHAYVIKSGLETDPLVGNALVSLYAKCGLIHNDAYAAFNSIDCKDVISWNAMVSGLAENHLVNEAYRLFALMLKGPTEPNYATIASILPVCASLDPSIAYFSGREIHGYVLRRIELTEDISVCNALVSFYLKVGCMEEAEAFFQQMTYKDLVSWNSIIAGYALNGQWSMAVDMFHELVSVEMIQPDSVTILSVLPACAYAKNLQFGKKIHGYILRHANLSEDSAVGNSLVYFYAKCDCIEAAFHSFLMISRRDTISWNSMLDAFSERGYHTRFMELLDWMFRERVKPDFVTLLTVTDFCATFLGTMKVKETHCYSLKAGFTTGDIDPRIANAVLDAYAKCGNLRYACRIFESLSTRKNLVTCNSMLSGYVNCGSHDDAITIFKGMSEKDRTTWNLMIRVHAENDCPNDALSLLKEVQIQGIKPDAVTIMSILPACSNMASVHLLRQCHGYAVRACFGDVHLNAALLDVYAKCGDIDCASSLFQSCSRKDLVMFTAMVTGYALHGMVEEALKIFHHMIELGFQPDHVMMTAVLSACSRTGLVEEGLDLFYSMEGIHDIKPTMEQYACVVDLLARCGRIEDAYSFINRMPVAADASIWRTLLGACRAHHEVKLGRIAAEHLFEIESDSIGNYVVMSNLYAADARWDGVLEVRRLMRTKDLKKPAGCSWIEVDGRKNVFLAGDISHPCRGSVYRMLNELDQQIKDPADNVL